MTLALAPLSAIARLTRAVLAAGVFAIAAAGAASAQDEAAAPSAAAEAAVADTVVASGAFDRKRKRTSGGWEIVRRGDATVLRLQDDFRTGRGPDIKIFLSPKTFADANGQNATTGSLFLGQLDSNRGAAELTIPTDADLTQFQSVLVHCEEFSVLFGGSSLALTN